MSDYGSNPWDDSWPEDEDDEIMFVLAVEPDGSVEVVYPEAD